MWDLYLLSMFVDSLEIYLVDIATFVKIRANHNKKLSKFTKQIKHVDDMMIHNLVKYLVQTWLCLWDIKITTFKPESCLDNLLEICYFCISQTKSSLNKIFYKVVYHHIIYMCDFLVNLDDFFYRGLHGFLRSCGLHLICSHSS